MYSRVVEIASSNRYMSLHRGFMKIAEDGVEKGRVAISDIGVLILNAHGLTYSQDLLVALAEASIPVVICGSNRSPVAWLWPNETNHLQARRIDAQLACSEPTRKRLWQAVVKQKIEFQADLLDELFGQGASLRALVPKVRSGDSGNIEAQAARRYWRILFGHDFRRDRTAQGANSLLNYGYTIVRSAVARAVMAAGLHPTISINHKNQYNSFRLVDDLMEPFRPLVDWRVHQCVQRGNKVLTPETKEFLVNVLYLAVKTPSGKTPVLNSCYRMAASLAKVFTGEIEQLWLPVDLLFSATIEEDNAEWISIDVDTVNV